MSPLPGLRYGVGRILLPAVLLALLALPRHASEPGPYARGVSSSLAGVTGSSLDLVARAGVPRRDGDPVELVGSSAHDLDERSDARSHGQGSESEPDSESGPESEDSGRVVVTAEEIDAMKTKGHSLLEWIPQTAQQATLSLRRAGKIKGHETSQSPFTEYG